MGGLICKTITKTDRQTGQLIKFVIDPDLINKEKILKAKGRADMTENDPQDYRARSSNIDKEINLTMTILIYSWRQSINDVGCGL